MNNKYYNFEKIFILEKIKNNKYTQKILNNISLIKEIEYFSDINEIIKKLNYIVLPSEKSKYLVLTELKGEILKKCPGSYGHICCNYYVINLYLGCPINCSYCILQEYLNIPFIVINVNLEEIFDNLDKIFNLNKQKIYRIGTGELGDSLVYDYLTDFSIEFINFFSQYKNVIFELKTKTNFIDNLLKLEKHNNIVIGFSVNPQVVINNEEPDAFSLDDRVESIIKLNNYGYKIAIHFDPIVNIDNFDFEYSNLIDKIFKNINPENICWISLGTFRYNQGLKNQIEYNYKNSKLLLEEFFICRDNKYRYFKTQRITLYNKIICYLSKYSDKLPLYLCMESKEVWEKTLKNLPNKKLNLFD